MIHYVGSIKVNKSMPRKKTILDTIQHKLYRNAYLKRRGEVIYTIIHHESQEIRKTTNLTWHQNNFPLALSILERRYLEVINPAETAQNLRGLFDKYLALKSKSVTRDAIVKYNQCWNNFIKKDYDTSQLDEIKSDIIDIISTTHLSNNTTLKQLQLLSAFFRFCLDSKYISSNPISKGMIPKGQKKQVLAYTIEEIRSMQNSFPAQSDMYNLIQLIKLTGMRLNEARTIKKANIHTNFILVNGKGGFDRKIPVIPNSELSELLSVLKSKPKPFPWLSNKRPHVNLLKVQKRLNMNRLTGFHGIRKYYENMLIKSGMNIKAAAQIIGHTTAVQSKNYITELHLEELTKEVEKSLKKGT